MFVANWRGFVFVYDWDTVLLKDNISVHLSAPEVINLCTNNVPCALNLKGLSGNAIQFSGSAQFSCLSTAGCLGEHYLPAEIEFTFPDAGLGA